jgi:uncharacterized SAM-binding protein YcdF (DUF218 family)/transcriptional regulator with XRE-family HTH domain
MELISGDPGWKADLIIVAGSDHLEPPIEAARLYLQGKADRILVSGDRGRDTPPDWESEAKRYKEEIIRIFITEGPMSQAAAEELADQVVILEDKSTNTAENAQFSLDLLEQQSWWTDLTTPNVILLQEPYSLTRTKATFLRKLIDRPYNANIYRYPSCVLDIATEDPTRKGIMIDLALMELRRFELYGPNGTDDMMEVIIPPDIEQFATYVNEEVEKERIYIYIHEITHQILDSIYGSDAIVDSDVATRYTSETPGKELIETAIAQPIDWNGLATHLGRAPPTTDDEKLSLLTEAIDQRVELGRRFENGDLVPPQDLGYYVTLQNLLNNPVMDDLYQEIQAIMQENQLITPGLLDAIADGDDLVVKIWTRMHKVIYGITTASRKEAGEELYQIFQSNPQINIEPLIKYMMEKAPTLGRRMEILRHINNLTLQQLATNIDSYGQIIQKWEADISIPTAVDLKKFALYFGIELVFIEFIKYETNSVVKTRLEDALKAIDVTQLPAYPIFVADDAFFLSFEGGAHVGDNYVVAGEVIIFNLELKEGAFKQIEGDVAADGTITSLRVKIGTDPLQEVATNVTPLQTKITINGADYLAYVNSNGTAHLYAYKDINPDLAEALVRSFFEIKKREDAATGTTYITDLLAAASYGDQAAMKNELANLARLIYATYLLDNTLSALYSHHLNIVKVKDFFKDLTNFINSIQNTSCNPVLQGFTVFSTLP